MRPASPIPIQQTPVVVGVDLGLGGAIAVLRLDGSLAALEDVPTFRLGGRRDYDVAGLRQRLDDWLPAVRLLAIEHVHAMPRRLGGSIASFALGRASGLLEMWAQSRGVPLEIVPPKTWQRAMLPVHRSAGRAGVKAAAALAARRLFPAAPITHQGRADALLIAEFARRTAGPAPGAIRRATTRSEP